MIFRFILSQNLPSSITKTCVCNILWKHKYTHTHTHTHTRTHTHFYQLVCCSDRCVVYLTRVWHVQVTQSVRACQASRNCTTEMIVRDDPESRRTNGHSLVEKRTEHILQTRWCVILAGARNDKSTTMIVRFVLSQTLPTIIKRPCVCTISCTHTDPCMARTGNSES